MYYSYLPLDTSLLNHFYTFVLLALRVSEHVRDYLLFTVNKLTKLLTYLLI